MKAMMAGFAAMIVIGVGAYYALNEAGFAAREVYSTDNVRLE